MVSRYRHHLPQETPTQSRPLIIPWRSSIQAASEGLHGHRKLLILFFVTFITPPRQSLYKEGLHARQHVEDPINPYNARLNGQHSLSSPTIPRPSGISMEWLDPEYVNPVCQQHHAQVRLYRTRIRQWPMERRQRLDCHQQIQPPVASQSRIAGIGTIHDRQDLTHHRLHYHPNSKNPEEPCSTRDYKE